MAVLIWYEAWVDSDASWLPRLVLAVSACKKQQQGKKIN